MKRQGEILPARAEGPKQWKGRAKFYRRGPKARSNEKARRNFTGEGRRPEAMKSLTDLCWRGPKARSNEKAGRNFTSEGRRPEAMKRQGKILPARAEGPKQWKGRGNQTFSMHLNFLAAREARPKADRLSKTKKYRNQRLPKFKYIAYALRRHRIRNYS